MNRLCFTNEAWFHVGGEVIECRNPHFSWAAYTLKNLCTLWNFTPARNFPKFLQRKCKFRTFFNNLYEAIHFSSRSWGMRFLVPSGCISQQIREWKSNKHLLGSHYFSKWMASLISGLIVSWFCLWEFLSDNVFKNNIYTLKNGKIYGDMDLKYCWINFSLCQSNIWKTVKACISQTGGHFQHGT